MHRASSQGYKARARAVTKENERRRRYKTFVAIICIFFTQLFYCLFLYRALEQKKEAFAKAEVERRKEALELRRKGQKEATMRFKSVFKKPPTSTKPQFRKTQYAKGEYLYALLCTYVIF